ncbi:hypothetical protein [Nonomuraea rubra]|uniref:Uncharacterized protein n=1 Tax=Nonomuraea rubra TaxID=46180 RepID=A0A7X0U0A1_9ACTN|nr:hypothetical protein [Nonomuraea rubra]MBB6550154.1 hypothetical protein [Nonomuraea rubra]
MTTPTGGNEFLHELEVEVRQELRVVEVSRTQNAVDLPVTEWLIDPTDTEREEVGLRGVLGAIMELENGSPPHPGTEDGRV